MRKQSKETKRMSAQTIEEAARTLAKANAESEATISKIYWFPDDRVIRLVAVDEDSIMEPDAIAHPFYFMPAQGIPFPSGIALIHPKEDKRIPLPSDWDAEWSQAKLIFDRDHG